MEKIIADPTTIYHRKNTFFDIITTTKVNNGFVSEANKSQKSDRFIESHKKSQKSIKGPKLVLEGPKLAIKGPKQVLVSQVV